MSKKNGFVILYFVCILLSGALLCIIELAGNSFQDYEDLEFSSSMRGVNYHVFLPSKDNPAEFCLVEGRTDDLLLLALDYFYITQGDQIFHGIAVDNSRFEIHQELSGCWNIMRETNGLQVRLVNLSNNYIFFETEDTQLKEVYTEKYNKISAALGFSTILLGLSFAFLLFAPLTKEKFF